MEQSGRFLLIDPSINVERREVRSMFNTKVRVVPSKSEQGLR